MHRSGKLAASNSHYGGRLNWRWTTKHIYTSLRKRNWRGCQHQLASSLQSPFPSNCRSLLGATSSSLAQSLGTLREVLHILVQSTLTQSPDRSLHRHAMTPIRPPHQDPSRQRNVIPDVRVVAILPLSLLSLRAEVGRRVSRAIPAVHAGRVDLGSNLSVLRCRIVCRSGIDPRRRCSCSSLPHTAIPLNAGSPFGGRLLVPFSLTLSLLEVSLCCGEVVPGEIHQVLHEFNLRWILSSSNTEVALFESNDIGVNLPVLRLSRESH